MRDILSAHLQLSTQSLARRTNDAFPSIYSTTVSVVQGVVLGYLASRVVDDVSSEDGWARLRPAGQTLAVLFAVSVVLYAYNWLGLVLRWKTGYPDATVPVILAVAEFLPIQFSGARSWPYAFGALGAASSAAFWYSRSNVRRELFDAHTFARPKDGRDAFALSRSRYRRFTFICLTTTAALFLTGAAGSTFESLLPWSTYAAVCIALIGTAVLLRQMIGYLDEIYEGYAGRCRWARRPARDVLSGNWRNLGPADKAALTASLLIAVTAAGLHVRRHRHGRTHRRP